MSHVLSDQEVDAMLRSIGAGKKVLIKYHHPRDLETARVLRGQLLQSDGAWIVRRSSTSYHKLPSKDALIFSICELDGVESRSASQRRAEEHEAIDAAEPLGSGVDASDRARTQPAADPNALTLQLIEIMREQQRQHKEDLDAMKELLKTQRPPTDPHQRRDAAPSDIVSLYQMGDAIRGKDNPTLRLAPGLLIPRHLQPRFAIFSMPHLVYQIDPATGETTKMPRGTAVPAYKVMLSSCKLQFPNQVATSQTKRPPGKTEKQSTPSDHEESIRVQIEISERIFVSLLAQLDMMSEAELPTTREDWMLFLDAGAALLALYATLAFGYARGGSKVTLAYNDAIHNGGIFNTSKLWSAASDFRKQ